MTARMSESTPTITVIMIVFNGEALIGESIESVLGQTWNDWELLVVDDGSTDRTRDVVRDLAGRHPGRIRLVTHPDGGNHGMSASRRHGVSNCSSPFLIFLDHDDLMLPGALEEMIGLLEDHPDAGAVLGPNQRFWSDANGAVEEKEDEIQFISMDLDRVALPPGILPVFLSDSSSIPISPMIRREAYEATGGYESAFKGMYEDQVFFSKLVLSQRIYLSSSTWIRYRQHPDSCVARSFQLARNADDRNRYLNWLAGHMTESGMKNAQIETILHRELRRNRNRVRRDLRRRLLGLLSGMLPFRVGQGRSRKAS